MLEGQTSKIVASKPRRSAHQLQAIVAASVMKMGSGTSTILLLRVASAIAIQ